MLPTKFQIIRQSGFRGEDFQKNRSIRNKNCLWQPYLLTDRDEISSLYRGPSIFASYQVLLHLTKQFQRKIFFRNRPIRNKNCLWWPCLLTDQNDISNRNRGLPIDASYQFSVHLVKQFQRRRILKSANQKQESSVVAMFVNGSGRNEQSLQRTFHRCFPPSFDSFGQTVSEETILLEINQS